MIDECGRADSLNYGQGRFAHNYINITPTEKKDTSGASCSPFALQKRLLVFLLITSSIIFLASDDKAAAHGSVVRWADPNNPNNCIDQQYANMDSCCFDFNFVHPNNHNPQRKKFVRNERGRRIVTILLPEPSLVEPGGDAIDPAQARDILIQDTLRRELNLGSSIDQ